MKQLSTLDIDSLRTRSGLSDEMISAMRVEHLDRDDLVDQLGRNDFDPGETGFRIPYFDIHGVQMSDFNVRLHAGVSREENGVEKRIKYLRPPKSGTPLYFPPGFYALWLKHDYLIVTEGEKKAARLVQEGIPCAAIAGVWNWVDQEVRKKEREDGFGVSYKTPPSRDLMSVARGKKIILAFDSDSRTNQQVKYALHALVDSLLYHLNGFVQIIDVPGDPADKDAKWGLDDWLVRDPNGLTDLRSKIMEAIKMHSLRMAPLVMFRYGTSSTGKPLMYRIPNCPKHEMQNIHSIYKDVEEVDDEKGPRIVYKKICGSRLWISRTILSIDDNTQKFEMSYIPSSGNEINSIHGGGDVINFSAKGAAELYAGLGCPILTRERADMEEFFRDELTYGTRAGVVRSCKGTYRRGWVEFEENHKDGSFVKKEVYVFPHKVIEENRKTSAMSSEVSLVPIEGHAAEIKDQFVPKGSAAVWRETMITYLVPTVLPLLYISASLAGMLRRWTKSENFIFHIFAESSRGKSIALAAAESIWGDPQILEMQWRTTDNGLESKCLARNDMAMFLDEANQASEEVLRNSVYLIGNATEKVRASRDGSERKNRKFKLVALSSGERAILRGNRNAGQEARVLDVPLNILGNFWGRTITEASVAENVREIFKANFGHGAEPAIQMILACERIESGYWMKLHGEYSEALRSTLNRKATPQHIVRRAGHYALLLTATNLFLRVLGLDDQTIEERIEELSTSISSNLLQMSSDQFSGGETLGMLDEFCNNLASQRSLHFHYNGERPRQDTWGSVISDEGQPRFFNIIPSYMGKLVGEFDPNRIIMMLDKIEALEYNKSSKKSDRKKSARIDNQPVSCYCVDMKRIQSYFDECNRIAEEEE